MREFLSLFVKIIRWFLTVMFLSMMVVGGISTILFGLAALLVAPIEKLTIVKEKMRIHRKINVFLVIALFVAGTIFVPQTEPETTIQEDTNVIEEEFTKKIVSEEIQETDVIEIQEKIEEEVAVTEENVTLENSTFSIRFLDVGQADATLIECDGHYMLIDGGNKSSSSKIYAILEAAEIKHLDMIVGTHVDEDHIGGLSGALNYATADLTLCTTTEHDTEAFENFKKYAELNGGGIKVPEAGDCYSLGSSEVTILGINAGNETNDSSIVLKLQYGDTVYLFTGDAEQTAEQQMLDNGVDLSADVLHVGHHGSADSTSEDFLNMVMPTYAIISVGSENTYLHPAETTLNRLENANTEIYRTDLQGEIVLVSDGKTINISAEKNVAKEDIMISGEEAKERAEAEEKAKAETEAKVQEEEVTAPLGTDYVLNKNTKKFHYPSCRSVKQMKEKNAIYYHGTRDEVIDMNYEPCGNCHP